MVSYNVSFAAPEMDTEVGLRWRVRLCFAIIAAIVKACLITFIKYSCGLAAGGSTVFHDGPVRVRRDESE